MDSLEVLTMLIVAVISIANRSHGHHCPQKYMRFTSEHSGCLNPSPNCDIVDTGVSEEDKEVILHTHNTLRSKIANGEETRAGGLPSAANMLQMEWDDELADIAQKWATQCKFDHDCKECRAVENFKVGQNVGTQSWWGCTTGECTKPDWKARVTRWYDEVAEFERDQIGQFRVGNGYGHFTQAVWASSWKIGCGDVAYKNGNKMTRVHVCNYGPAGNQIHEAIYQEGQPCSACPSQTYCGGDDTYGTTYPGLCKAEDPTWGPVFEDTKANLLDCNWKDDYTDCDVEIESLDDWTLQPGYSVREDKLRMKFQANHSSINSTDHFKQKPGWYKTIILKAGEKTTVRVSEIVKPTDDKFCLKIVSRRGPTNANEKDRSEMTLLLNDFPVTVDNGKITDFTVFMIDAAWGDKTEVAIECSVPEGATDHIFDIKSIAAFDGVCDNETTNKPPSTDPAKSTK